MPVVVKQLQILWNMKTIQLIFDPLFAYNDMQAVAEMKLQHASPTKS